MMSERRTITLKHPIDHGSETITVLTIRRGRAGDLRGIKVGAELALDDLIKIAARMTGQPTQVIEKLDGEDCGEVLAPAAVFFGLCLRTGKEDSQS